MHKFTDTSGADWPITIDFGGLRRVRDSLDFDLTKLLDGGAETKRIGDDPVLLVDALYLLVKPEAEKRVITDAGFGERLDGETLERATTAMAEALIDFFPQARRDLYRRAVQAGRKLSEQVTSRALQNLTKMERASTSTPTPGDSPELPESTPATSTA